VEQLANTHQAEAWNGYEGEHWARHQDRWDAVGDGINSHLFAAAGIRPDDHVLDIGCGNGKTTRLAAKLACRGDALGVDLSGPMLAAARASAADEGIFNIEYRRGDAQVYPFEPGSFDVAISRGGVMFFDDPAVAFHNIRTALRPAGLLAIACFRRLEEQEWFVVLMSGLFGEPPRSEVDGSYAPGMFSLADPSRVDDLLMSAGFEGVSYRPVDVQMNYGRDAVEVADFWMTTGPVRFLRERGDASEEDLHQRLITALRPFETEDGVQLTGSYWVVTAVNSAR
jgi:SAM-dependent methyltransferase